MGEIPYGGKEEVTAKHTAATTPQRQMALQRFRFTAKDVERVRTFVSHCKDRLVSDRIARNIVGPAPNFDREPVSVRSAGLSLDDATALNLRITGNLFLAQKPFPLAPRRCSGKVEHTVVDVLRKCGGIRMAPNIGKRSQLKLFLARDGGWGKIERQFAVLAEQRARPP